MVLLLRAIRKNRWKKYPEIPGLADGESQADVLLDLRPAGNRLSVFEVPEGREPQEVAIALAAARDDIDNIDFVLFEDTAFEPLGISIEMKAGNTPNESVNQLHRDLINLTVRNLAGLSEVIASQNPDPPRILRKAVPTKIVEGIKAGNIDPARLTDKIKRKVVDGLYSGWPLMG